MLVCFIIGEKGILGLPDYADTDALEAEWISSQDQDKDPEDSSQDDPEGSQDEPECSQDASQDETEGPSMYISFLSRYDIMYL